MGFDFKREMPGTSLCGLFFNLHGRKSVRESWGTILFLGGEDKISREEGRDIHWSYECKPLRKVWWGYGAMLMLRGGGPFEP
jgi:hypothetical protein